MVSEQHWMVSQQGDESIIFDGDRVVARVADHREALQIAGGHLDMVILVHKAHGDLELLRGLYKASTQANTELKRRLAAERSARAALVEQLAAGAEREHQLRAVLGIAQTDLIQCQQHRSLCLHEQDALRVVNDALCDILPDDPGAPASTCLLERARALLDQQQGRASEEVSGE